MEQKHVFNIKWIVESEGLFPRLVEERKNRGSQNGTNGTKLPLGGKKTVPSRGF